MTAVGGVPGSKSRVLRPRLLYRKERPMMNCLKVLAGPAVLLGFLHGPALHAQVYGAQGYNPYTGNYNRAAAGYNPYTGTSAESRSAYNPSTGASATHSAYNPYTGAARSSSSGTTASGTNVESKSYHNPYTGRTTSVQGARNPYTGNYAVHASTRR